MGKNNYNNQAENKKKQQAENKKNAENNAQSSNYVPNRARTEMNQNNQNCK